VGKDEFNGTEFPFQLALAIAQVIVSGVMPNFDGFPIRLEALRELNPRALYLGTGRSQVLLFFFKAPYGKAPDPSATQEVVRRNLRMSCLINYDPTESVQEASDTLTDTRRLSNRVCELKREETGERSTLVK